MPKRPPRPSSWDEFLRLRDDAIQTNPAAFKDFLSNRKDAPPQNRAPLGKLTGLQHDR